MNQITEDYISYEIAKLLKEKGFNEICHSVYDDKVLCSVSSLNRHYECGYGDLVITCQNTDYDDWENKIAAPTLQMALKWLREVYDLHIIVYPWQADNEEKAIHWCCTVYKSFAHLGNDVYTNETPKSYEESVEAALKYSLENLI